MKLPASLLREFASAANSQNEKKENNIAYGTVRIIDGATHVLLDGSETPMPVSSLSNVRHGDRVTVSIDKHTATITGNVTSKSATNKDLEDLEAGINASKNAVIYAEEEPGGTSWNVGDTWFDTDDGYSMHVWNGETWDTAALDYNSLAANAIRAVHIFAGAVTADKIAANAVTADKIAAGSITTNKLFVGDMTNLVTVNENDPNSMITNWNGYNTTSIQINSNGQRAVVKANLELPTPTEQTTIALTNKFVPNTLLSAGDKLYYSIRARVITTARNVTLRVGAWDETKTWLGSNSATLSLTTDTSVPKYTGTITLTDNPTNASNLVWAKAAYYVIYINDANGGSDQIRFFNAEVRKKSTGALIIDGTITAEKLSADAIDGKTITGGVLKTADGTMWLVDYNSQLGSINSGLDLNPSSYAKLDSGELSFIQKSGGNEVERASLRPMRFRVVTSSGSVLGTSYGWYCENAFYADHIYTGEGEVITYKDLNSVYDTFGGDDDDENLADATKHNFTPTDIALEPWSTLGNCWYYKIGSRVHLHVAVTGLTADTNTEVYTMAAGYRPMTTIVAAGRANNGSQFASMWIGSGGKIAVRSVGTSAAVDIEYDAFN